jgi:hypothetical protein
VGENGSLQLNRSIKGLEGQLKIRVMAGDFNATLTALKRLESRLPDGVTHRNNKMIIVVCVRIKLG